MAGALKRLFCIGRRGIIRRVGAIFQSNVAKGQRLPPDASEDVHHRWDGLSMFSDRLLLAALARTRPGMGAFIAELHIPADAAVSIEPFPNNPHHFTVRGDAEVLLGLVVAVTLVDPQVR